MKIVLFTAMLAGFFAALGAPRVSEPTARAATVGAKARCILRCEQQRSKCSVQCSADSCPCDDQYGACLLSCDELPN